MLAAAGGERDGSILAAVFESGCGARNDNQRTFQIGAAIPQRAIASITKRKIPSSPWRLSLADGSRGRWHPTGLLPRTRLVPVRCRWMGIEPVAQNRV